MWAAGVVVFQMLYGKRPFGEGCTQEAILREEVILKAHEVAFPPKPAVSPDARDFMTRCGPAQLELSTSIEKLDAWVTLLPTNGMCLACASLLRPAW